MKTLMFAVGFAAFAVGCAQPEEVDEFCKTNRCEVAETTFSPEPELKAYTEAMITRISRATGRTDLAISDEGIPVYFQDYLKTLVTLPDGSLEMQEACALTKHNVRGTGPYWVQGIAITSASLHDCSPTHSLILHEAIHALNPLAEHSLTGVFEAQGAGSKLDENSLAALCAGFDCPEFNPE